MVGFEDGAVSFQETRSAISICNKALGRIQQGPLSGTLFPLDAANQNKLAGRECARWYKSTVRWVLEQHHFGLARKRVALVEVTNDRSSEWTIAYQPPTDMAFPVIISPYPFGASQVSYYQGVGSIIAQVYGRPIFRYEGGVIYSLYAGGSLDYVSFDITEADFNETVEELIVRFLSSKLALSVAKDRQMAGDLEQDAIGKLNLAIAQSLNADNPRYGNFISEAELARGSFGQDLISGFRY